MIGTLQATSIFVSTISITAIALDRYQVSSFVFKIKFEIYQRILSDFPVGRPRNSIYLNNFFFYFTKFFCAFVRV